MKKYFLIILLVVVIVSGIYATYIHSEPDNFQKDESEIDIGEIHYIENVPVLYIEEEGYKAGIVHGKLLKQEVNEMVRILKEEIIYENKIRGFLIHTLLLQKAKQLDKHIPQTYREEMKGIADGAEVSYNDILLINTYDDLLYLTGCSSIAITKNEKNGTFIHARNLDYLIDFLSDKNTIFHYTDKEFISIGFPGYIGALSATNYSGITLSSHTSIIEKDKIGIPSGILYRKIIEESENIQEVETILKENKRTIGNNLLVSSATENKVVVFEITADEVYTRTGEDYIVSTNHFISDEFSETQSPSPNSIKRYNYLENFYKETQNIDENKIKTTMSFFDGNEQGWSSVANKGTVQSVIFVPEKGTIYIGKGTITPVNQEGFVEYELPI